MTLRLAAADGRTIPTDDVDQLARAAPCCDTARWHHQRIEDTRDEIAGRPPGYRTDMLTDRLTWHRAALDRHRCPT